MDFVKEFFQICRNVFSFLFDRVIQEYEYIFRNDRSLGMGDAVRGDFYVTEIVKKLKYDPCIIQGKTYSWLRIPHIAEVEHLETFVQGLKRLHKADVCEIIERDGQLYVNASVGAAPLYFNLVAWVTLPFTEQLITIRACLNYCKVNAKFSVDAETGRNGSLQSLRIDEFSVGEVNVFITEFKRLSCLLSNILTLVTKCNRRMVRNVVEFGIERYISQHLPSYQFPIIGKNVGTNSVLENFDASGNGDKSLHMSKYSDATSSDKSSSTIRSIPFCGNSASGNSTGIDKETPSTSEKQQMKNASKVVTVDYEQQADSDEAVEVASKENPTNDAKNANKLESDIWLTNVPLLEGNAANRELYPSDSDADNIRLEFKFSKSDVILEDVEPLSRTRMTTCCVFFRSEVDFIKELAAKETGNNSPFKYSKDFLKDLLATDDSSAIGGNSKLSEKQEKQFPSERTRSSNEILMRTFCEDYPNFITLIYNAGEELETRDSNKKFDNSSEAKSCKNTLKGSMDTEGTLISNVASITSSYSGATTLNLELESMDSEKLSKTVDQLCVLKAVNAKGVLECLSMDGTPDHIETDANTMLNKTTAEGTTQCLKSIEKRSAKQENRLSVDTLTKKSAGNGQEIIDKVQDTKKINRVENIESILKWNSESIKELKCLDEKNSQFYNNEVSEFVNNFIAPKMILKDNISKNDLYGRIIKETCKSKNVVHRKRDIKKETSFKMPAYLRRENKNEFRERHNRIAIGQLKVIECEILKCFENSWMETDLSKHESKHAEEFDLNINVQDLEKETEEFEISLDEILEEADARYRNYHAAKFNSSLQSPTARSDASEISEIVKIFFENNPIEKLPFTQKDFCHTLVNEGNEDLSINRLNNLLFKDIPFTVSDQNGNELNLSVSTKVDDFSNLKDGLICDSVEESAESLKARKIDLSSKDSTKYIVMASEVGTKYGYDEVLDEELDWTETLYSDDESESSIYSNSDTHSEDSVSADEVFVENVSNKMYKPAPEIDSSTKNESDAVGPRCETRNIDNESLEVDLGSESFDVFQLNTTLENQLEFPSKTDKIETENILFANTSKSQNNSAVQEDLNLRSCQWTEAPVSPACDENIAFSSPGNSSLKKSNYKLFGIPKDFSGIVNVEKVILADKVHDILCGIDNEITGHKEHIASLNGVKSGSNEKKDELGIGSKSELAKIEDHYLVDDNLISSPEFEESYDRLCVEILLLISEDTNNFDVLNVEDAMSEEEDMFSPADDSKEQNKVNYADITNTLRTSTDKGVENNQFESFEKTSLEKLHVGSLDIFYNVKDEYFEYISELTKQLNIRFEKFAQQHEEAQLNSFTEAHDQKLYSRNFNERSVFDNEKKSDTEINSSIFMDNNSIIEQKDKSFSCSDLRGLSNKNVTSGIVDLNGRVAWKKALQIWGFGDRIVRVHPDKEHSNNQSKIHQDKLFSESLTKLTSVAVAKLDNAPEIPANIINF